MNWIKWSQRLKAYFTRKECLFIAVKLTKNADKDKYSYSGYSIAFDFPPRFSYPGFDWDKNVIIYGVDNSASIHIDNKKKDT